MEKQYATQNIRMKDIAKMIKSPKGFPSIFMYVWKALEGGYL